MVKNDNEKTPKVAKKYARIICYCISCINYNFKKYYLTHKPIMIINDNEKSPKIAKKMIKINLSLIFCIYINLVYTEQSRSHYKIEKPLTN